MSDPLGGTGAAPVDGAASRARVAAVRLEGISKRYGRVVACDGVDMTLERGRVHGVLGENGAGKSTLMKILIGLVQPDAGSITVHGERKAIADPLAAADLGIAMVHQHYSLVEPLTVWENVILGERVHLDRTAACERVAAISARYGLGVDPLATVSRLTAGQRQRVEIIKCLRREPEIIVFDEPTSVLTPAESEQLFTVLRAVVVEEHRAVALVSHKLDEILHATDEVTIIRGGRVVDRVATSAATASSLAQSMVGRPVSLRSEAAALGLIETVAEVASDQHADVAEQAPIVLEVRGATVRDRDGRLLLDDLSIAVRRGEIVGLAGVEGNGQRALADVLSSLIPLESGDVRVGGVGVVTDKPGALGAAGVGVIPEDRHDSGCVLDLTVAENLVLADLAAVSRAGLLDRKAMEARASELMQAFEIQAASPQAPMRSLSGGNQRRVVLARELSANPRVLIAAQPTHGLDVGAIEYMTARLRAAAADGVAVLLISTELEEVLTLSDRVCVIYHGRIVGEMSARDTDVERLGLLMGGAAGVTATTTPSTVEEPGTSAPAPAAPIPGTPSRWRRAVPVVLLYVVSVAVALGLCALLVWATGGSATEVFSAMLDGSLPITPAPWGLTVDAAAPLLCVAVGTIWAGKAGLSNIGQEGQVLLGAAGTAYLATRLDGPGFFVIVAALAGGVVFGGLWALLAAVMKYTRSVPEVISTLLLYFIAIQMTDYALTKRWLLASLSTDSRVNNGQPIKSNARLPSFEIFGNSISAGVIIAVVLTAVISFTLARTTTGFRLRMLGFNPRTTRRAGVSAALVGGTTLVVSGATAGLAGAIWLTGGVPGDRFTSNMSSNIGWQGLLVALLARQRVLLAIPMAFVSAILRTGSQFLSATGVDRRIADVVQAMLVLALLVPPAIQEIQRRRAKGEVVA